MGRRRAGGRRARQHRAASRPCPRAAATDASLALKSFACTAAMEAYNTFLFYLRRFRDLKKRQVRSAAASRAVPRAVEDLPWADRAPHDRGASR
jgi:hypothetical protein